MLLIRYDCVVRLPAANGNAGGQLPVRLRYAFQDNPWEMQMIFGIGFQENPTTWVVARDLMIEIAAGAQAAGEGDITFINGDEEIEMVLKPPGEKVSMYFSAGDVREFVELILKACPQEEEQQWINIEELDSLLE